MRDRSLMPSRLRKKGFGPLSTDAILHYDVFYHAINTEYWCPELVFPQRARNRCAEYSIGPRSEALPAIPCLPAHHIGGRAQIWARNAANREQTPSPHGVRCPAGSGPARVFPIPFLRQSARKS